jgi:menaquinol-cytochrome c reductase iron-sulfur subunit
MKMMPFEFQIKDGWLVLPQKGFVWVKTEGPGLLRVFSSKCTHLACNVVWQEDRQIFVCPCHAGYFDANGKNISGPPTKPLSVLEHRIDNGNLLVFLPS